ncbi:HAD-superfamily hydrolase subfamily IA, variant 3 [Candidatus Koribacter versatilis Ellin345]|uniref:HAD-superfamily hydrolase subfamily IA, variant 3 n=1 Tax=Koribacter versatilis (strain Ellin345) TaxID=204669 RepID=Q1IVF3_KORVE|nr:HAD family phosphatase [Candidatus Koribacter versatilis]ABF39147.1 HAD-superfamily hydrolase subfamily IA, variant 3 [Candidatus Koribacter versatilis Ellin345]
MQLKAIVFDYGMVLSLSPTEDDWSRLASVFNVSVEQFQEPYWDLRLDYDRAVYTGQTYWFAVAEHLGKTISHADVHRLIAFDNEQWTKANPEMLEFAWQAKAAGLKIGILSNMQSDMLHAMRQRLNWLNRFDAQIYTCDIGSVKPEPEAYRAVLAALHVSAGESLFFDDKQPNIDGARAVGMHAELFEGETETAYQAVERLGVPLAERKCAD